MQYCNGSIALVFAVLSTFSLLMQCLFKHVQPDASGMETVAACREDFERCNSSRTASIVLEYANDNELWKQEFAVAYQILIQNGYEDAQLVLASPTVAPTDGTSPGCNGNTYLQIATLVLLWATQ